MQARLLVIKGNSIFNQIYKSWYSFRLFSQQNISWSPLQVQFLGPPERLRECPLLHWWKVNKSKEGTYYQQQYSFPSHYSFFHLLMPSTHSQETLSAMQELLAHHQTVANC